MNALLAVAPSRLPGLVLFAFLVASALFGFGCLEPISTELAAHPLHLVFTAPEFLLLALPGALLFVFIAEKFRLGLGALIAVSLAFYLTWGLFPFAILCTSILTNFTLRSLIIAWRTLSRRFAKALLCVGVCFNLLLLAYFKYAGFFAANLNDLFSLSLTIPTTVLPIGISFYTFQEITLAVDAYRGCYDRRFINYVAFITFFPHLISGPLLHHREMVPQFSKVHVFSRLTYAGLALLALGAFKKLCIADPLASVVAYVFDSPGPMDAIAAWEGALAYTFQLYFDFSGYSDMALALGLLFNIKLPVNFFSPYKSASIIEFWRRWHMTLARFLREYLYFPLGGNRKGPVRRYLNLMIVMIIGGLWHGAAWTYVAWGGLHGLYLMANHAWNGLRQRSGIPALPRPAAMLLTFTAVVVAWVAFRAPSLAVAESIWKGMLGLNGLGHIPRLPTNLVDLFGALVTPPLPIKDHPMPLGFNPATFNGDLPGHSTSIFSNGLLVLYLAALYGFCLLAPNTVELTIAGRLHVYGCPDYRPGALRVQPTLAWGAALGILVAAVIYFCFDTSPIFLYWTY